MSTITFRRNGAVAAQSICDLREAVGWDRLDWYYPAAFSGYWGTVSGFDDTGKLVVCHPQRRFAPCRADRRHRASPLATARHRTGTGAKRD